jgi:hypothetical protein
MDIDSHLNTCVDTQSPKYLEMAQGHISLSVGRGVSGASKGAETRKQRARSDLNRAATARLYRSVFWVDLGEILNWGALVDDSRHGLLHWLHNYIAE